MVNGRDVNAGGDEVGLNSSSAAAAAAAAAGREIPLLNIYIPLLSFPFHSFPSKRAQVQTITCHLTKQTSYITQKFEKEKSAT